MPSALMQFLASLAAIFAIVVAAWLLGFRQGARLSSEAEARELFRLAPGGFEPVEMNLDADRRAAIARDRAGRIAVLAPHGDQFVFRLLAPESPILAQGDSLTIGSMPDLRLTLGDSAGVWANTDSDDNKG
jgi:hypothetical protein